MSTASPLRVLGGARSLGAQPKSAHAWHELISGGVPVRSAEALKQALQVSDTVLAEFLGISEKTLSRARKTGGALDAVASDRLFRVAKIAALARRVLERDAAALSWLRRPQFGLGGETPLKLLTTSAGADEVERLLLRIEHGVYA